jgi:hypothetical protein
MDITTDTLSGPTIYTYLQKEMIFGVYGSIDGAVILKKNYSGQPLSFQPFEANYNYKSFVLSKGSIVKDAAARNGFIIVNTQTNVSGDVWYGPYAVLAPGKYQVTFNLKGDILNEGNQIQICVSRILYSVKINYDGRNETGSHLEFEFVTHFENNTLLSSKILTTSDFSKSNSYSDHTLNFSVETFGVYEFRGSTFSSGSRIYFNGASVTQTEASPNLKIDVNEVFPSN